MLWKARMTDASFPYRLAACDLDGTLLGPNKEIGDANLAAVAALQNRGVRLVVASGRRHQNSLRFYRQLGLDGWMISCAGALVKDPDTDETLREVVLPPELAVELVASGQAAGYTVIYYHRDHLYIGAHNHWTELYESRVGEKAELFPGNLNELQGDGALKIVWYGEPDALRPERQRLEGKYGGALRVLSTDPENLEFSAPGANKAEALVVVAQHYGVPQVSTLAFGDGENDAPMLAWAGLGVAMDGGSETARAAAGLVGPAGAPAESLARAVEAMFLRTDRTAGTHD